MHLSSQCHGMGERYSFPHTTLRKTKVQKDEVTFPWPPRMSGLGKEPNPAYRLMIILPLQTKLLNAKTHSLVVFSGKAGITDLALPLCSTSRKSAQVQGQNRQPQCAEHHSSVLQLHQLSANLSFAAPGHRNSSLCASDGE